MPALVFLALTLLSVLLNVPVRFQSPFFVSSGSFSLCVLEEMHIPANGGENVVLGQ